MSTLAERLIQLRTHFAGRRGQRKFAQLVGIKQQSISNYERGAMPGADVLAKIVRVTGCSADWLLTARGTMFPDGREPNVDLVHPPEPTFIEETGARLSIDELAKRHDIRVRRLTKLANDVGGPPLRGPDPTSNPKVVIIDADRKPEVYELLTPPRKSMKHRVELEVTTTEVRVHVPPDVLVSHSIKVMPKVDLG